MPGLSNNPRNFPEIRAVLDEAIKRGGLRYTCQTHAQAVMFRMKAYHLRKLEQKLANEDRAKGTITPTPYDALHMSIARGDCTVVITFPEVVGTMTDLAGLPITPMTKKYEAPERDEFVEIAETVKKGLIGD